MSQSYTTKSVPLAPAVEAWAAQQRAKEDNSPAPQRRSAAHNPGAGASATAQTPEEITRKKPLSAHNPTAEFEHAESIIDANAALIKYFRTTYQEEVAKMRELLDNLDISTLPDDITADQAKTYYMEHWQYPKLTRENELEVLKWFSTIEKCFPSQSSGIVLSRETFDQIRDAENLARQEQYEADLAGQGPDLAGHDTFGGYED